MIQEISVYKHGASVVMVLQFKSGKSHNLYEVQICFQLTENCLLMSVFYLFRDNYNVCYDNIHRQVRSTAAFQDAISAAGLQLSTYSTKPTNLNVAISLIQSILSMTILCWTLPCSIQIIAIKSPKHFLHKYILTARASRPKKIWSIGMIVVSTIRTEKIN